jgi:tRNA threonylcarbamoyladenosine biosynthesis protein TsaE
MGSAMGNAKAGAGGPSRPHAPRAGAPAPVTLELSDLEATRRAGLALGRALRAQPLPRAIVLCSGPLGAGKTTLIKAVCEALGIAPHTVISPTYTLVNVYPGRPSVYHVDLFRLEAPEALLELDPADWINPEGITLIEWPDVARPLLAGQACLELALAPVPGRPGAQRHEARRLTAADPAGAYADALAALRGALAAAAGPGAAPAPGAP